MPGLKHKPLSYGIKKVDIRNIARGNPQLTEREVEGIVINILIETFSLTMVGLKNWILKFVPKRTGQLRDNLVKNIQSSRIKNLKMILIIRTSIDYAERVNAYATSNVRHKNAKREHYVDYTTKKGKRHRPYAYAYYYGHYGRIKLNDPQAIGGFFDKMIIFAIKSVLFNLDKIKRKYSAKTKMKFKEMKIIKLW